MLKIITAAVLAASVAIPTVASAEDAALTARVHYGDLDLSRAEGRTVFSRRMSNAVASLCGTPDIRDLDAMSAASRCRTVARNSASQQVAALTGRYALASAKTGSNSLPG